jgi:hypothetical protein
VTRSNSWLCRSSRADLRLVAEGLDTLDRKVGLGVLEEFGSIKLRGGVILRIALDLQIPDLANLSDTVPPRDPDDDDGSEDEEDDDRNEELDPAVIGEPDE